MFFVYWCVCAGVLMGALVLAAFAWIAFLTKGMKYVLFLLSSAVFFFGLFLVSAGIQYNNKEVIWHSSLSSDQVGHIQINNKILRTRCVEGCVVRQGNVYTIILGVDVDGASWYQYRYLNAHSNLVVWERFWSSFGRDKWLLSLDDIVLPDSAEWNTGATIALQQALSPSKKAER